MADTPWLDVASQAFDARMFDRHFEGERDVIPLWIAEPYVPLSDAVSDALRSRADLGWYGYETRPRALTEAFWAWMDRRHGWDGSDLSTSVSPSIGTTIAVVIDAVSEVGDGVILQPPVFTDFKPLVTAAERVVQRASLTLDGDRYRMDLDLLDAVAADPSTKAMILCNPHNPVGRVWEEAELRSVAEICAEHDVVVISDEIHADITIGQRRFVPFAEAARGVDVRWVAMHGPIKTFGLAGVTDTLMVTDDRDLAQAFRSASGRYHLTRNNVFGLAAIEAAYTGGEDWLDGFLDLIRTNRDVVGEHLPPNVRILPLEGTYLAWLDFRDLGLDVPELARWLATTARVALSPGHWFGREGAGFARMTIAADTATVAAAADRIAAAAEGVDAATAR